MKRMSKMWRSGLAMLLALCLLISAGPVTAFAAVGDDIASKYELTELKGFLEKYGPKAAEQAREYLANNEYVIAAQDKVEETIKYLQENEEEIVEEIIPYVEDAIDALEDQAAELNKVLEALTAELDAKIAEKATAVNAEVAAEIDAAIAKIEAAIAAVDAQIAEINKQVVALNKALEELVAAVEAVAAQIEVVIENGEALVESIENLVEVLMNTDEVSSEAVAAAYEAGREAVLNALETMEAAVELVDTQIADVVAQAKAVNAQIIAVNESTIAALNAINELPAEVLAAVAEAVEGTHSILVATAIETAAELKAALEALEAEVAPVIAEKKAELDAILAEVDAHVAEKAAELKAIADEKIAGLSEEEQAVIDELKKAAEADIEKIKAAAEGDMELLKAHIEEKKAELKKLYEEQVEDELKADIEAVEAEIEALEAQLKADIEALNACIAEKQAELEAKIEAKKAEIKAEIAKIEAELKAEVEAIRAEVEAAYNEAVAAIKAEIAALEAELKAAAAELNAKAEAELAKLYAAKDEITNAVNAAIAQAEEQLAIVNAKVEELIEAVKAAFVKATTSDLVLGRKSVYVALGDGTAASKSYVDLVGERVKTNFKVKTIKNYAEAGNTVGAEAAKVATREGIADAALITIGFGNVTMLDNAIRNAGKVNYDWAKLVGAEMVPYVKEALATATAKVAEAGLPASLNGKVASIVEGIAYAAVEYAVELPKLIAEIRAVNTDAVILVVGQYNPMAGVVLDMDGTVIDLNAYIDGFVAAVTAHGIGYAMITGDAIFVEAPAVETSNTDMSWTEDELFFDLVLNGFKDLYPSDAGDMYIANQILEALDITKYVPTNPFVDVKESDYFYDAVMWAVEMGITNGTKDGTTFEPNTGCTRAQIATFLWRFAGCPAPKSTEMPFTDVADGKYYTTAILWAAEQGITTGTKDGTTFEPNATCTRAQIVTMLARYLDGTPVSKDNPFVDVPAGAYYTDAVLWAVENGITTGTKDGDTFEPNATCTRAHVVTFLYRSLDY